MSEKSDKLQQWESWLARQTEAALEPDLPILDAHHHLWDRGGHRYLKPEFRQDTSGHRLLGSIYVECLSKYRVDGPARLRPVGETEYVMSLPEQASSGPVLCRGIVGAADLSLGDAVDEVLQAHLEAAGGAFKGVRYVTAWDPSPEIHGAYPSHQHMLREPAVQAGARRLGQLGLSLDVWLYFHQLDDVVALARACRDLTIVVNHCGGPIGVGPYATKRDEVYGEWKNALALVAGCENVSIKIGGLGMKLAGFSWRERAVPPDSEALAQAWKPYVDACVEAFGPYRALFESNFPVDRAGCTYTSLWNAFKRLTAGYSQAERALLMYETASRTYKLRSPLTSRD